ncbi:hypothetical protein GP486_007421 [Trichoglossum hirsutum]|uniref:PNPLA domain-containing protein n=1 Tax=Trichoglossum hirsutum TaxID=265104 RepID=A0A9P8IBW3_9PEZI|nr:hypothetical protein GP486_007421 [Trichoglossum hirsutum]
MSAGRMDYRNDHHGAPQPLPAVPAVPVLTPGDIAPTIVHSTVAGRAPTLADKHDVSPEFAEVGTAKQPGHDDPKLAEPIRLLSLDGGGIHGLSSIQVLRRIMAKVNEGREVRRKLEPYEFFDLIGGTGTGGVIAIMLGRLQMSMQEVEDHYISLSETISDTIRVGLSRSKRVNSVLLEEKLKTLATRRNLSAQTPLRDLSIEKAKSPCRVTYESAELSLDPVLPPMQTWEAALATIAVSPFFTPIEIRGHRYSIGCKWMHNNPMGVVYQEAQHLWPDNKDGRKFVFLSIGAGAPPRGDLLEGRVARSLADISHATAETYSTYQGQLGRVKCLFRFNLPERLGVNEYKQRRTVEVETEKYMYDPNLADELNYCVAKLDGKTYGMRCPTIRVPHSVRATRLLGVSDIVESDAAACKGDRIPAELCTYCLTGERPAMYNLLQFIRYILKLRRDCISRSIQCLWSLQFKVLQELQG